MIKKTITVTLGLKDKEKAETYNTFEKLKTEVLKCGNASAKGFDRYMQLTVQKVKVLKDAPVNENLVVKGTVSGDFYSKAKYHETKKIYAFHWDGKQIESGRDSILKEGVDDIQATLIVEPVIEKTLKGDISIGDDTENKELYPIHKGDVISFNGALDMSEIQKQMGDIETIFGVGEEEFSDIKIHVGDVTFITTLTLPKGLTFSQPITKDGIKLENFGKFYIEDAVVEGNKVTITMKLYNPDDPEDTDHIANYQKLKNVVDDIGDKDKWMKIIVPGIKVDGDVKDGDMLTIFGTVDGTMQATADFKGKHRAFDFKWNTIQTDQGRDARFEKDKDFAAKTKKESFTFTMIVKSSPTPPTPSNPTNPGTPVTPNPTPPGTPVTPNPTPPGTPVTPNPTPPGTPATPNPTPPGTPATPNPTPPGTPVTPNPTPSSPAVTPSTSHPSESSVPTVNNVPRNMNNTTTHSVAVKPSKKNTAAKTGDENHNMVVLTLMISSLGLLSVAILKRKNNKAE